MKSTTLLLHRFFQSALLLVAFFSATASVRAAEIEELGNQWGTVAVPSGVSAEKVKAAIIATLAGREWNVQERADDHVTGYLKHRSNEAKVTLKFNTETVEIYCVGYQVNKKTGMREKPELPEGWLKRLRGDLTKQLNLALLN